MATSKQSFRSTTYVAQACTKVKGFKEFFYRIKRRMKTSGRSESTFKNYTRHLAQLALHYNALPGDLSDEQIEDYLYLMQQQHNVPSESHFKHTVFGLRFAFRMDGLHEKRVALPKIKQCKKLPIVLSKEEVKLLLKKTNLLKHRILIALLYDCGLRCMEIRGLQLKDIDLDRRMLHIRQSKGKKDRYVPFGDILKKGLRKYIKINQPVKWLFNGNRKGEVTESSYSQRGVQLAIKQAIKHTGIRKEVSVHILRHTYATHLLEAGTNIMTIQKLLGHGRIETTMVYLHVAEPCERPHASILDQLYEPIF
jgi:integrase/recombinase XerD